MDQFYPEILLGPPGTGKTTALLDIVDQEMSKGTSPDRIAFLSFTRKAADEAITRATKKFSLSRASFPYFRTIHSLAFHQLGLKKTEVLEGERLLEFGRWAKIRITGRWSDDGTLQGFEAGDKILHLLNLAKVTDQEVRHLYNYGDYDVAWSEVERVAKSLALFKRELGLYDFNDMLEEYLKRGQRPHLEVLLCDEVQDQSALQWKVIEKLALGARRVVLAGDDDQGIYEWSGADVPRIINQVGDVRVLDQSYRVTPVIQDLAFSIINRVRSRRPKTWNPRSDIGNVQRVRGFNSVDLSGDDILILSRNTFLLRDQIEPELRKSGIIYEKNGYSSVKQTMLKAIIDWESLRTGHSVPHSAVQNIYNYMSAAIGYSQGFKKLPGLEDNEYLNIDQLKVRGGLLTDQIWHQALDRIPIIVRDYIIAARRRGEKLLGKPRVRISTIHRIKGDEAEHVVLFKEQARKTFKEFERSPDSEHRVFYVGVTRAKTKLTIVDSLTDKYYPYI